MPNEENSHPLSNFSIPKAVLGRTGEALSRLVGAPIGAIAARLERGEAVIQARTDGQAEFQRIVARSAAEQAVQDPDFMQRAMETFGRDLVNKQLNKEAVASIAVHKLENANGHETLDANEAASVDDDWLNFFSRYAEGASSDNLRERLAALLSGEIKKPGSHSFSAVRFIAEMDQQKAELIDRVLNHNFGGALVYAGAVSKDGKVSNNDLATLQGLGLITGLGGVLKKELAIGSGPSLNKNQALWPIEPMKRYLLVTAKAGVKSIKFKTYPLTMLGLEIQSLVNTLDDDKFIEHLKLEANGKIESLKLFSLQDVIEILKANN